MKQKINEKFNELLKQEDYRFLKENENLGDNIAYLTLGGSRAYGTNKPTSDVDVRGFYIELPQKVLSLEKDKKEEVEDKATDTVVYSLKKFFNLLLDCNPNVIEMLGTRPEDIVLETSYSKVIRALSKRFLSKRAYYTFGGYATAQLRRLENALARDSYPQKEKEKHILMSLENEMKMASYLYKDYNVENMFNLYLEKSQKEDFDTEIFLDANLKGVPLRDFLRINSEMSNMIRNYSKLTNRNKKKDEEHLYKHAMHLIRLYLMGIDVLKEEKIITYREKEHDLLMSIRNGEMTFDKIFQLQKELEKEFESAFKETKLPETPNYEWANHFYYVILSGKIFTKVKKDYHFVPGI